MQSLDEITFDTTGYTLRGDQGNARLWYSPAGDGVGLYHFPIPPDIGASLDDVAALRVYYRNLTDTHGLGLLEVEQTDAHGVPAVRTLFKAPQEPTGRTYVGSITLPFRDFSYVLKVQAAEAHPTGLRDTVVFSKLLTTGVVTLEPKGGARGWVVDPYQPDLRGPMTANLSESAEYDAIFPDHPLSRARATLRLLTATVLVSDAVRRASPFVFPRRA